MALPPGRDLDSGIASESRPQEPLCAVEDLPRLFPNERAKGRRALDDTNWCRCCDKTISRNENAAFCEEHKRARNTQQKQVERSVERPARVDVPADAVDAIVRETDRLQAAIGRATAEFNRMARPPIGGWVDDLMLVAKDLTWAVDHYLRPVSNRRRLSERARRRSAAPQ